MKLSEGLYLIIMGIMLCCLYGGVYLLYFIFMFDREEGDEGDSEDKE